MPEPATNYRYLVTAAVVLAAACIALVQAVHVLTRDRISDNKQLATRRIIQDIVPAGITNDIFADTMQVIEPDYLGSPRPVTVYRARVNDNVTGVIFYPVVAHGYNNPIELGVGISRDGVITGVRVISQNETEGLGALVDQRNSDWIEVFSGISYETVPAETWAVSDESGYFDAISGATITSRSVINAVSDTLDYHEIDRESLYK